MHLILKEKCKPWKREASVSELIAHTSEVLSHMRISRYTCFIPPHLQMPFSSPNSWQLALVFNLMTTLAITAVHGRSL